MYIYHGLSGIVDGVSNLGLNFAQLEYLNEGFKVVGGENSSSHYQAGAGGELTPVVNPSEAAFLMGKHTDVTVEFTYLNSNGTTGIYFLVADDEDNIVFSMSYNKTTGKYHFITSNEDISRTGNLESNDNFKIIFSTGNIKCYRNNQTIYTGPTNTSDLFIGFKADDTIIYDKFMIKVNGFNNLRSALIRKGITQLINSLSLKRIFYSILFKT